MALLDWFEEHASPTSFTDTPGHAGIAVGKDSQRLRLDRETLRLTAGAPDAEMDALSEALRGTWQIVEPQTAALTQFASAWSYPLDGDYDAVRRAFTARTVGTTLPAGADAYDCAALLEIKTKTGLYGVEYGVVTAQELAARLERPDIGIARTSPEARPPLVVDVASLPPVSMFADVARFGNIRIASHQDLLDELGVVETEARDLVIGVGRSL